MPVAQKIDDAMDALSNAPEDLRTQSNLEMLLAETKPLLDLDPTEEFKEYYHRKIIKLFRRMSRLHRIGAIGTYQSNLFFKRWNN